MFPARTGRRRIHAGRHYPRCSPLPWRPRGRCRSTASRSPSTTSGPYEVPLGQASLPNGIATVASFAFADAWPLDVSLQEGVAQIDLHSLEPDGKPFQNYFDHGWRPGVEGAEAVLDIRGPVVREGRRPRHPQCRGSLAMRHVGPPRLYRRRARACRVQRRWTVGSPTGGPYPEACESLDFPPTQCDAIVAVAQANASIAPETVTSIDILAPPSQRRRRWATG